VARIIIFVAVLSLLYGCDYAFTGEEEIQNQLLEITPLGISREQARLLAEGKFGQDAYMVHGPARYSDGDWKIQGGYTDRSRDPGDEPYFFAFRLSSYPSPNLIFPTNITATWFFDGNGRLVKIDVQKKTDSL
jgi:hypothetical protein